MVETITGYDLPAFRKGSPEGRALIPWENLFSGGFPMKRLFSLVLCLALVLGVIGSSLAGDGVFWRMV